MFFSRIKAIVTVLLAVMSVSASAQRYFADGYHGGVLPKRTVCSKA